jgi:hypothetical protein
MGWISNPSTTNAWRMMALVGMFNLWHVVEHHWHFGMGARVHPTKCIGATWERWQLCWSNLNKQIYVCKTPQSCMGCLELDIRIQ